MNAASKQKFKRKVLKVKDRIEIINLSENGKKTNEISTLFGVSPSTVTSIKKRKNYWFEKVRNDLALNGCIF